MSRSTSDSMAGRIGISEDNVKIQLRALLAAALVETQPLKHLTVWQLTYDGRTAALQF